MILGHSQDGRAEQEHGLGIGPQKGTECRAEDESLGTLRDFVADVRGCELTTNQANDTIGMPWG